MDSRTICAITTMSGPRRARDCRHRGNRQPGSVGRVPGPRVHALYITNYPDQSQYSPLYNGDSFYHLWFQFTQISDKIKQQLPSGVINANIATANVYGNTIRDSGICDGA